MLETQGENRCAIVIVADGFDETEAVAILSGLRRAGAHAKSVGLLSGMVGGLHGIWMMPDLTLTDLEERLGVLCVDLVILPGSRSYLATIGLDPRVRRLLQQVLDRDGWIVTNTYALRVLRDTLPAFPGVESGHIVLHFPEQPVEAFVEEFVPRYLRQLSECSGASLRSAHRGEGWDIA